MKHAAHSGKSRFKLAQFVAKILQRVASAVMVVDASADLDPPLKVRHWTFFFAPQSAPGTASACSNGFERYPSILVKLRLEPLCFQLFFLWGETGFSTFGLDLPKSLRTRFTKA